MSGDVVDKSLPECWRSQLVANNIRSKFSEFSIDYNTNLRKMAQECTLEVTSRQMKFLTALREKGHSCLLQRSWSCLQSTTVVSLVSLAS